MSAQLAQAVRDLLKAQVWQEYRPARDFELMPTKELAALREALSAHEAAPQQEPAIIVTIDDLDLVQDWAESRLPPGTHKLYAAPQQAQAPGWQLVPVEPTPEMKKAAVDSAMAGGLAEGVSDA